MKQIRLHGDARELEEQARAVADSIKPRLAKHVGFTLFLYDERENGNFTYISTSQRASMVSIIRAWIAKVAP